MAYDLDEFFKSLGFVFVDEEVVPGGNDIYHPDPVITKALNRAGFHNSVIWGYVCGTRSPRISSMLKLIDICAPGKDLQVEIVEDFEDDTEEQPWL